MISNLPIALAPLLNIPLTGLMADLAAFPQGHEAWQALDVAQRIQLLDNAVAVLLAQSPETPLVPRIQTAIHQIGLGNLRDTSLIPDVFQALEEIQSGGTPWIIRQMKRALQAIRIMQPDPSPPDEALRRFRLITARVQSDGETGILIRGPAGLLRFTTPQPDVLDEFGKLVTELWRLPRAEARGLLHRWTQPTKGGHAASEIHCFFSDQRKAEEAIRRLSEQGFDIRYALIPDRLWSTDTAEPDPNTPVKTAYWITGRQSSIPLLRWSREFGRSEGGPVVERLDLLERTGIAQDDPEVAGLLQELFGRPIAVDEFLNGFATDVPGYVTRQVRIGRWGTTGVSLYSEIATQEGELAAQLSGWLPNIPPPGMPWIAWGDDLNEALSRTVGPERIAQHFGQGIGRRAMQKILSFLYLIGVNAMEMEARGQGVSFMPRIGFDFASPEIRDRFRQAFQTYLRGAGIFLSPQKEEDLQYLRHAWQFLDFQDDKGVEIGRNFFDLFSGKLGYSLRLRFQLSYNYAGWKRLWAKQLAPSPEEQVGETSDERRETDSAVSRRFHDLVGEAMALGPVIPPTIRSLMEHLVDHALFFEGSATAARAAADHDPLTGLVNRRALMRQNGPLEKSLGAQRTGDPGSGHWVLMLDIDHFKGTNDTHGHLAGDAVLRRVARVLKREIRDRDIAARYGGEEFCVVLQHSTPEGAAMVAERIRAAIEDEPFPIPGGNIHLTVSIGVAPFRVRSPEQPSDQEPNPFAEIPARKTSLELSIGEADRRLYEAKRDGRNRVVMPRQG